MGVNKKRVPYIQLSIDSDSGYSDDDALPYGAKWSDPDESDQDRHIISPSYREYGPPRASTRPRAYSDEPAKTYDAHDEPVVIPDLRDANRNSYDRDDAFTSRRSDAYDRRYDEPYPYDGISNQDYGSAGSRYSKITNSRSQNSRSYRDDYSDDRYDERDYPYRYEDDRRRYRDDDRYPDDGYDYATRHDYDDYRDRGRDYDRDHGRDMAYGRDRDRDYDYDYDRDRDRAYDHNRDRGYDRDRDRERDYERDRDYGRSPYGASYGKDRDRDYDRARERDAGYDRDRDQRSSRAYYDDYDGRRRGERGGSEGRDDQGRRSTRGIAYIDDHYEERAPRTSRSDAYDRYDYDVDDRLPVAFRDNARPQYGSTRPRDEDEVFSSRGFTPLSERDRRYPLPAYLEHSSRLLQPPMNPGSNLSLYSDSPKRDLPTKRDLSNRIPIDSFSRNPISWISEPMREPIPRSGSQIPQRDIQRQDRMFPNGAVSDSNNGIRNQLEPYPPEWQFGFDGRSRSAEQPNRFDMRGSQNPVNNPATANAAIPSSIFPGEHATQNQMALPDAFADSPMPSAAPSASNGFGIPSSNPGNPAFDNQSPFELNAASNMGPSGPDPNMPGNTPGFGEFGFPGGAGNGVSDGGMGGGFPGGGPGGPGQYMDMPYGNSIFDGHPVSIEDGMRNIDDEHKKKKKKMILIASIAGAVLIALIIILVVVFSGGSDSASSDSNSNSANTSQNSSNASSNSNSNSNSSNSSNTSGNSNSNSNSNSKSNSNSSNSSSSANGSSSMLGGGTLNTNGALSGNSGSGEDLSTTVTFRYAATATSGTRFECVETVEFNRNGKCGLSTMEVVFPDERTCTQYINGLKNSYGSRYNFISQNGNEATITIDQTPLGLTPETYEAALAQSTEGLEVITGA